MNTPNNKFDSIRQVLYYEVPNIVYDTVYSNYKKRLTFVDSISRVVNDPRDNLITVLVYDI